MINLILLIASFVLLLLASYGMSFPRANLGWLGLALYVLTFIITAAGVK